MDCGVLQEMKLNGRFYMRGSSGFLVKLMAAPSAHSGGVVIFYHEAEHFSIEELRPHGLNVTSFQLVTGRWRWHVVGG